MKATSRFRRLFSVFMALVMVVALQIQIPMTAYAKDAEDKAGTPAVEAAAPAIENTIPGDDVSGSAVDFGSASRSDEGAQAALSLGGGRSNEPLGLQGGKDAQKSLGTQESPGDQKRDAVKKYSLYLAGVQVTSDNATDILGDGTAGFNPASNTLTLVNCVLTGNDANSQMLWANLANFNIVLVGNNCLVDGALVSKQDLTISGDGSLTVSGGYYQSGYTAHAIYVEGVFTIAWNFYGTIVATGGTAIDDAAGVNCGSLVMNSSTHAGTLIATGGNARRSTGISVRAEGGTGLQMNQGLLFAQGGNGTECSYGIFGESVTNRTACRFEDGITIVRAGLRNGRVGKGGRYALYGVSGWTRGANIILGARVGFGKDSSTFTELGFGQVNTVETGMLFVPKNYDRLDGNSAETLRARNDAFYHVTASDTGGYHVDKTGFRVGLPCLFINFYEASEAVHDPVGISFSSVGDTYDYFSQRFIGVGGLVENKNSVGIKAPSFDVHADYGSYHRALIGIGGTCASGGSFGIQTENGLSINTTRYETFGNEGNVVGVAGSSDYLSCGIQGDVSATGDYSRVLGVGGHARSLSMGINGNAEAKGEFCSVTGIGGSSKGILGSLFNRGESKGVTGLAVAESMGTVAGVGSYAGGLSVGCSSGVDSYPDSSVVCLGGIASENGASYGCDSAPYASHAGDQVVAGRSKAYSGLSATDNFPACAEGATGFGYTDYQAMQDKTALDYNTSSSTIPSLKHVAIRPGRHTLTLHISAIDGVDHVDPIRIENIRNGTYFDHAMKRVGLKLANNPFTVDGYESRGHAVNSPLSEYESWEEVDSNRVVGKHGITQDVDIYYTMIKNLTSVKFSIDPPVCGARITTPRLGSGDWDWDNQTNKPRVTALQPEYCKLSSQYPGWWIRDYMQISSPSLDPYEGTIEIGSVYHLVFAAQIANFGCQFYGTDFEISGATYEREDICWELGDATSALYIGATITAVHDWSAPTYTWSADNKTCTATHTCKNPECKNEETEVATVENGKVTSKVTKQPTTTSKGQTTYTATFVNAAFAKQAKTVADIPQLPSVSISSVSVKNVVYAGDTWGPKPALTVVDAAGKAVPASAYTVSWAYNTGYKKAQSASGKFAGTATATVSAKANSGYRGSAKASFKVTTVADTKTVGAKLTERTVTAIEKLKDGASKVPQANSKTMETIAKPREKTMTVKWNAVTGATNYLVGYKSSKAKEWSYEVSGGKTSHTFKNMNEGDLMEFRVAVYDAAKVARSEWTQINCRFYREMVSLKAIVGKGKIDLKWGKVSAATGYQVLLGTKSDLSDAEVITVKGGSTLKATITKFKGEALQKGKTYYLKMRSIKSAKNVNGKENTYIGIQSLRRDCKITG